MKLFYHPMTFLVVPILNSYRSIRKNITTQASHTKIFSTLLTFIKVFFDSLVVSHNAYTSNHLKKENNNGLFRVPAFFACIQNSSLIMIDRSIVQRLITINRLIVSFDIFGNFQICKVSIAYIRLNYFFMKYLLCGSILRKLCVNLFNRRLYNC